MSSYNQRLESLYDAGFKERVKDKFQDEYNYPTIEYDRDVEVVYIKKAEIALYDQGETVFNYGSDYFIYECYVDSLDLGKSPMFLAKSIVFKNCIFDVRDKASFGMFCNSLKKLRFINCAFINDFTLKFSARTSLSLVEFEKCEFCKSLKITRGAYTKQFKEFDHLKISDCTVMHHFDVSHLYINELTIHDSSFRGNFLILDNVIEKYSNIFKNKFSSKYFVFALINNDFGEYISLINNKMLSKLWISNNKITESSFYVKDYFRYFIKRQIKRKVNPENALQDYLFYANFEEAKVMNYAINRSTLDSFANQFEGNSIDNRVKLECLSKYHKFDRKLKYHRLRVGYESDSISDYFRILQSKLEDCFFGYYLSPIKTLRFVGMVVILFAVIHYMAYGFFNIGYLHDSAGNLVLDINNNPIVETNNEVRILNSIYFSLVSLTTLGYGDMYYSNNIYMKLFASLEGLFGVVLFALLASIIYRKYSK